MEQRYGTDPSRRYGAGVVPELVPDLLFFFDLHPYIYI